MAALAFTPTKNSKIIVFTIKKMSGPMQIILLLLKFSFITK